MQAASCWLGLDVSGIKVNATDRGMRFTHLDAEIIECGDNHQSSRATLGLGLRALTVHASGTVLDRVSHVGKSSEGINNKNDTETSIDSKDIRMSATESGDGKANE